MHVLLRGGRVVDPGSGTDTTADVLVRGSRIEAVAPDLQPPADADVVDARGLIVGPGFVDLHSHVHSIVGHRLQALDGVTTSLDLEAGLAPVARAYAQAAQEGRPLNYGFSASWGAARAQAHLGWPPDATVDSVFRAMGQPQWQRSSTPGELAAWLGVLGRELGDGALGIGVLVGYAPRSDPDEYLAVARLAAAAGAPTFTHVRELSEADPRTPVDGSEEVARAALQTGAAMHHCHVNSTSRRHVDRVLAMLEGARGAGGALTVEVYPYGAGSTAVGAFFLAPERLSSWGLSPSDVTMLRTGERVSDAAHLNHLRATRPAETCVVQFLDEREPADAALLHGALAFPDAIVASDAMPVLLPDGRAVDPYAWPPDPSATTHPRTAGTFSKALRLMVRESGVWSWTEAFRRCSYLPSRVLAQVAPAMADKGHLAVGADADLAVLDPDEVTDLATFERPTEPSVGVRHLLVGGSFVVRDGRLELTALPGTAVRGRPR